MKKIETFKSIIIGVLLAGVIFLFTNPRIEEVEKEKINTCQIKFLMNCMMLMKKKVLQLKKERMFIKWQSLIRHLLILGGNKLWLELIH